MTGKKILIVEDEPDILELLIYNLKREGFEVISANNGIDGLELFKKFSPDLALLDLMLPGLDGLEICKEIKGDINYSHIPIIILTAKSEESDIVLGLGLGADDYMSKPFSPKELIARIKARLRSLPAKKQHRSELNFAGLVIDHQRHRVSFYDQKIKLTATEFRILYYLASNPGQVFSRDQLMNQAYTNEAIVVDRNIDVHIRSIRKKIGDQNNFIETIRGVGYSFMEEPS